MKQKQISIPIIYTKSQLDKKVGFCPYEIVKKSLDARKKGALKWIFSVQTPQKPQTLSIRKRKDKKKVLILGSGPAGIFAADIFSQAGFSVIVFEKGCDVIKRKKLINDFESKGILSVNGNYVFGEGGAGTFSDGKLSNRTKSIKTEKSYILNRFIEFGAPEEIRYLNHPHIGSNKLPQIAINFRNKLKSKGVTFLFEEEVKDIKIKKDKVFSFITNKNEYIGDIFFIAGGHSNYNLYRTLINKKVLFRIKPLAIGARVEHKQSLINLAQWGKEEIKGLKSAEYRLTSQAGEYNVFTFCMCPGGRIVQSTPVHGKSVVNGMSNYLRNGKFANSAVVCAFNPLDFNYSTPQDILNYIESLENKYFNQFSGFTLPAMNIKDFIKGEVKLSKKESSYLHGIKEANLFELLPKQIVPALQKGLLDFSKKIQGFQDGLIMGLESKTSSPIQVIREKDYSCTYKNLYISGEMSGFAGGIISSAADAIKISLSTINNN